MSDCRIVFNEQTGKYRIERRSWLGWGFLMDANGEDYLTFDDYEAARGYACRHRRQVSSSHRRWQVVDLCRQPGPAGSPGD